MTFVPDAFLDSCQEWERRAKKAEAEVARLTAEAAIRQRESESRSYAASENAVRAGKAEATVRRVEVLAESAHKARTKLIHTDMLLAALAAPADEDP